MTTIAIIQARIGSQRLPGKVLMDIVGKPMLQRVFERVRQSERLDAVVVATSFAEADQQIVRYCQANGIPVLRGGEGENDVLGRYVDVATLAGADVIVRITADCPMIDATIVDAVIAERERLDVPYLNNVDPRTFPDGLDVEVFTAYALWQANAETQGEEREHVSPFMRRQWTEGHVTSLAFDEEPHGDLKWSVDTQEDLDFTRSVYEALGEDFGWRDVLNLHHDR